MAAGQARPFVASTALASRQKGQVLASAGGGSLIKLLLICQTTNAITMKAMIALTNAPQRMSTSGTGLPVASVVASFSLITRELKSTPPRRTPLGGRATALAVRV